VSDAVQINFHLDRDRAPEDILRDWHSLVDIAAAASSAGVRVSVLQACATEASISRRGVDFHFVAIPASGGTLTRTAAFARLMQKLSPEVAHVHGLGFPREVLELRALAPRLPILAQDHADRVPRFWRHSSWRRALAECAAVAFCAREQANAFRRAGLLAPHTQVFEIPESTSEFMPGDQAEARATSGIGGDPCLLWIAHLDANKDPLTVLDAVSRVAAELPGVKLWCCFGSAPLREVVEARIAHDARLQGRVQLLGCVPHEREQTLMRAADMFVLGSHREGSSFSLIEALATGLTPVVTDIPSLRVLTGHGAVGELWACGDAAACAQALLKAAAKRSAGGRAAVRAHFDATLSQRALGAQLAEAYDRIGRPVVKPAVRE
jgi:glycosyltransferase involved in cell wall biosynthesis